LLFLAVLPGEHDISCMKRLSSVLMGVVMCALVTSASSAQQVIPPGGSIFNPPPPPAPPPPAIQVPVVPQMDAPPSLPTVGVSRPSFGDRITQCLEDGAASGLGPNARSAYSRSCANQ
jgi:hypothetical protein